MLPRLTAVCSRISTGLSSRALTTTPALLAKTAPSKEQVSEVFRDDDGASRRPISAYNVNRVEIMGGVAADVNKKVTQNGNPYAVFTVITNVRTRGKDGEYTDQREAHSVTAFGRAYEYVAANVTKGKRVLIHGKLHYSGNLRREDGTFTPKIAQINANDVTVISSIEDYNRKNAQELNIRLERQEMRAKARRDVAKN